MAAPIPQPARGPLLLWLYGVGMLLVACAFVWRYPLIPNAHALADIGKLARYQPAEFAGYLGGMAALWLLYFAALRESRRLAARHVVAVAFGCGAALAFAFVWLYPVSAIDVFLYAVRSRLLTAYGQNPIAVPFATHPADAWMPFATQYWSARVSPYGPLWNLVGAPITAASGADMPLALLGFKLLSALCVLAAGYVVMRTAHRGRHGQRASSAAIFFMWNPLVLWEGVGNAHNDTLVILLILLALWAWEARRDALVLPLLVLATLLKYVALPLLPLAAVAVWFRLPPRQRPRAALASAALCAAAVALALFPFYDLAAIPRALADQQALPYTSPTSLALALLAPPHAPRQVEHWATLAGIAALCLTISWQLIRLRRSPQRLPRACFETLFVLILALASARGWYLIWLVGLAAALPGQWPRWRCHAWAIAALATYAFFIWVEAWWQPGYSRAQVVGTLIMLVPTLAVTAAEIAYAAPHVFIRIMGPRAVSMEK